MSTGARIIARSRKRGEKIRTWNGSARKTSTAIGEVWEKYMEGGEDGLGRKKKERKK